VQSIGTNGQRYLNTWIHCRFLWSIFSSNTASAIVTMFLREA
jgi:hypothetical protein